MKRQNAQSSLWPWYDLCDALGLPQNDGPNVGGISFDSRQIQSGDLFVALPGDPGPRFKVAQRTDRDGHDFVEDAIQRGAVGALVHKPVDGNCPTLQVEDTIDGLWNLARYRRRQLTCPVVAVTGSSGKTTLKSFLAQALPAFSTKGSFNNYIGLPVSMAITPLDAKAVVYEIGTNHEGEIAALSQLAMPDIAVVLNVLPVHIGFFPGMDALTVEKFSIYQGLTNNGILVCSQTLSANQHVPKRIRIETFGFDQSATVQVKHISNSTYSFTYDENQVEVRVPGGGKHRAETMAATATVLRALNYPLSNLSNVSDSLPTGRGNIHDVNGAKIIDESYNANPASMEAALQSLLDMPAAGRRIAVLGQMNELGDEGVKYHTALAKLASRADIVFCVGELMEHLYHNLGHGRQKFFFENVDQDLLTSLTDLVQAGDTVLVKGSHSFFWEVNFIQHFVEALKRNDCN